MGARAGLAEHTAIERSALGEADAVACVDGAILRHPRGARGGRDRSTGSSSKAPDRFAARLYAGWLSSSLDWSADVAIELRAGPGRAGDSNAIELGDGDQCLSLRLGPSGRCVEASARVAGARRDVTRRVARRSDASPR